jgi:hypothetical protein
VKRLLGSWSCPSGNSCDVFIEADGPIHHVEFAWDRPLSPEDERH